MDDKMIKLHYIRKEQVVTIKNIAKKKKTVMRCVLNVFNFFGKIITIIKQNFIQ